ncbi:5197_t:CDS:1, partial [Racocetra persica]
ILPVKLNYNDLPQEDTLLYNKYLDDENEVDYLIEQLPINNNDLLSASEYIKINNDLSTTKIPSNQEILAALQEEDDNDTSEPLIQISLKTALKSLENIKLLLLNLPEALHIENDDLKVINSLKKCISYLITQQKKQSNLENFFSDK